MVRILKLVAGLTVVVIVFLAVTMWPANQSTKPGVDLPSPASKPAPEPVGSGSDHLDDGDVERDEYAKDAYDNDEGMEQAYTEKTTSSKSTSEKLRGKRVVAFDPNQHGVYEIDRKMKDELRGNVVFNAPDKARVGDPFYIHLIISANASLASLVSQLESRDDVKSVSNVMLTRRMKATVTGAMFDIHSDIAEKQGVSSVDTTEWKWTVVPKQGGKHRLQVTLYALYVIEGVETPRVVESFPHEVDIDVTDLPAKSDVTVSPESVSFLAENWQYFLTGLFLIVGFLFTREEIRSAVKRLFSRDP